MAVESPQCLIQNVERVEVRGGRVCVADLEGLRDTTLVVSFVRMAEEDVGFPCLFFVYFISCVNLHFPR